MEKQIDLFQSRFGTIFTKNMRQNLRLSLLRRRITSAAKIFHAYGIPCNILLHVFEQTLEPPASYMPYMVQKTMCPI